MSSGVITVIDYGIGNVHSVLNAFRHEGATAMLSSDPDVIRNAERLVLPGVGAFGDGMRELGKRQLIEPLREAVAKGTPLLGICLGMQLLLSESEEFGRHAGLGFIAGTVKRIEPTGGEKIPHIGWNRLHHPAGRGWSGSLLEQVPVGTSVYFVHSFTAVPNDEQHRLADTTYGGYRIAAAIQKDNVTGCQFHPEKSGPAGLQMVRRFSSIDLKKAS